MQTAGKALVYVLVFLISALILSPLLFTVAGSFAVYWGADMYSAGVTLSWYAKVFEKFGHTIGFTLVLAFCTVLVNTVLGTMAGYWFYRWKSRWVFVLEELLSLPIAVPGIAIALALIQTYPAMRASGALMLVGHVIITFPLMFRTVLGTLRTKDFRMLDECAATLGAGPMYRFFHVIFPSIRGAILSGAVMVFMLSLGEFNMNFFLYTPLTVTLPIGLYEAYSTLRIELGSAYTTLFLAMAIPLMYLLHRLNQSSAFSRNGGV